MIHNSCSLAKLRHFYRLSESELCCLGRLGMRFGDVCQILSKFVKFVFRLRSGTLQARPGTALLATVVSWRNAAIAAPNPWLGSERTENKIRGELGNFPNLEWNFPFASLCLVRWSWAVASPWQLACRHRCHVVCWRCPMPGVLLAGGALHVRCRGLFSSVLVCSRSFWECPVTWHVTCCDTRCVGTQVLDCWDLPSGQECQAFAHTASTSVVFLAWRRRRRRSSCGSPSSETAPSPVGSPRRCQTRVLHVSSVQHKTCEMTFLRHRTLSFTA